MTISIENMKTLCDEVPDGNICAAVKIVVMRQFVPDAIRVMEQMAEASRNAREPLLLKYVEPQWDGDYGEVYCGEWCKYCKQHVGDDEGKGQSLIDREYGHKPECPISKNLSALAAYNELANPQETVKGDGE